MLIQRESKNLTFWNWFAVFFITQALFFLTLIPFDFTWPTSPKWLVWGFELQDIVQNLLLFFPLGVVFQHTIQRSIWLAVLYGTLVSSSVELIQLFEIERTSSYNDIVMNALSTMFGALYYRYFITPNTQKNLIFLLVYMLIPLCWFIAMRSATQHFMAWLILPLSLMGLKLYKDILVNNSLRWLTLCFYLALLISPLIYISRKIVFFSFLSIKLTPAVIILILTLPFCFVERAFLLRILKYQLIPKLVLLAFLFIMIVNLVWFETKTPPISWTVPAHLHWIDTLMSFQLLVFVLYLDKGESFFQKGRIK